MNSASKKYLKMISRFNNLLKIYFRNINEIPMHCKGIVKQTKHLYNKQLRVLFIAFESSLFKPQRGKIH